MSESFIVSSVPEDFITSIIVLKEENDDVNNFQTNYADLYGNLITAKVNLALLSYIAEQAVHPVTCHNEQKYFLGYLSLL